MSNLKIIRNDSEIPFESFVFPAGEVSVKIVQRSVGFIARTGKFAPAPFQTIVARINNSKDLMELILLVRFWMFWDGFSQARVVCMRAVFMVFCICFLFH